MFREQGVDSFDCFVDGAAADPQPDAANCAEGAARRRLAIVDPSRLRRDCLKLALGLQRKRWQVSDVATAAELVRLVARGDSFAVILLGAPTCRQIRLSDLDLILAAAGTPVLVAADCDDQERALAFLRAGASGFLPTNLGLRVLLAALERVRVGGSYVPSALTDPVAAGAAAARATPWQELTRRQREVLVLVAEGFSNKRIAAALSTSESTVKAHLKEIMRRLGVSNRTEAALLAARAGTAAAAPARAIVTA